MVQDTSHVLAESPVEIPGWPALAETGISPDLAKEHSTDTLVLTIDRLVMVQDRFDAQHSDPTGTSAGDDGENADGRQCPNL